MTKQFDPSGLGEAFKIAGPEYGESLGNQLTQAQEQLSDAQAKADAAAAAERSELTRGIAATRRLQQMRSEAKELESRALDAAFSNDEDAQVRVRRHSELTECAGVLHKAIARHLAYAETDYRRSTLDAELTLLDAEILLGKLSHAITLNEILSAMKQVARVNGGQVKLDSEALFTGRIAELQLSVHRLEDRKLGMKRKIELHASDTREMREQYTRNFEK